MATVILPVLAIVVFVLSVSAILASAGTTLGFDFLAYHQAAVRVLAGEPLYDMTFQTAGGFGLFFYPPMFLPMILPLGLLSASTATWLWTAMLVGVFVIAVALLPVPRSVRWWTLLLAGLSFPVVHAFKLGQVGPILFLTVVIGWRWLDRPAALGISSALGAAIKVQPGLLLVWALLTGRIRAVLIGGLTLAILAVLATMLAGLQPWWDFVTLIRTVSDPILTVHNFTPGAIAYQFGVSRELAGLIQVASTVAAVGALLGTARWLAAPASYLVAVVVSQLVSPILWDHYTLLLLAPVAYLLAAGRWWALAIPLVTAWPLVGITPALVYPLALWATILGLIRVGPPAPRWSTS